MLEWHGFVRRQLSPFVINSSNSNKEYWGVFEQILSIVAWESVSTVARRPWRDCKVENENVGRHRQPFWKGRNQGVRLLLGRNIRIRDRWKRLGNYIQKHKHVPAILRFGGPWNNSLRERQGNLERSLESPSSNLAKAKSKIAVIFRCVWSTSLISLFFVPLVAVSF